MEVWPSDGGMQVQPSNSPMLLGRQGPGSERLGKALIEGGMCVQGRRTKVNRPMKRRNSLDVVETVVYAEWRDKAGRNLTTVQSAAGVEAARTLHGLGHGTGEAVVRCQGKRHNPVKRKGRNTDACNCGGPRRSSEEAAVTGVERRARLIRFRSWKQPPTRDD